MMSHQNVDGLIHPGITFQASFQEPWGLCLLVPQDWLFPPKVRPSLHVRRLGFGIEDVHSVIPEGLNPLDQLPFRSGRETIPAFCSAWVSLDSVSWLSRIRSSASLFWLLDCAK